MFKYFKEMRELKKKKLLLETVLVSKLYGFIDGMPDLVSLAKRAKDMDMTELQKLMAAEIVNWVKTNEAIAKEESGE